MAPTKPYILISPGSFGPAPRYALLLSSLRKAGYYGHVLYYPSFSQRISSVPSSLYDDAAHAAEELRSLIEDQGLEVLFIGHSYGGCVISEAAKEELSLASRGKEGKTGGLVGLVYLAGMVPKLGQTGDAVLTERGVKILGMLTLNVRCLFCLVSLPFLPAWWMPAESLPQD
jgi:pimeloyl-ACP methyl ester carboxylesterase